LAAEEKQWQGLSSKGWNDNRAVGGLTAGQNDSRAVGRNDSRGLTGAVGSLTTET
jgi:hypothetical protein